MGTKEKLAVKHLKVHRVTTCMRMPGLMVLAVAALLLSPSLKAANLTTFVTFDPARLEVPENITVDEANNLYVSLILNNEVRKITPDGAQSTYVTFDGAPGSLTTGLAINDDTGDLFVAFNPAGQDSVIYVVHTDHSKQVFATFPAGAVLNGLTPDDDGNLYVADSVLGVVWRVGATGGAPAVWVDLHAPGAPQLPGPNGVKFDKHQRNLYVSVSFQGTIYRVPVDKAGNAGTPAVFVSNIPPDDFAFDRLGNLYVATEPAMSVVRVRPDGTMETIASAADGLQNTTAVRFGRHADAKLDLYILSAQIPPGSDSHPAIFKLHVGLPGLPVSIPR